LERQINDRERFPNHLERLINDRERFPNRPERQINDRERFPNRPERQINNRERFPDRSESVAKGPLQRNRRRGSSLQEKYSYGEKKSLIARRHDYKKAVYNGPMARWPDGPMARWPDGPMARWPDGPMARWPDGPDHARKMLLAFFVLEFFLQNRRIFESLSYL